MASTPNGSYGFMSSFTFTLKRILLLVIVPRLFNRRFAFAFASVATIASKLVHIYAHINALVTSDILQWGTSFFLQDTIVLLLLRWMIDSSMLAATFVFIAIVYIVLLALTSLSFFFVAGSELQWRNVALVTDSSSWGMLVTGLVSLALVTGSLCVLAAVIQTVWYTVIGAALDLFKWPCVALSSQLPLFKCTTLSKTNYKHLPQYESDGSKETPAKEDGYLSCGDGELPLRLRRSTILMYTGLGILIFTQTVTYIFRPGEGSFVYMSWTLPLMPFVDFAHSKPTLSSLLATSVNVSGALRNKTALTEPIQFSWLPQDTVLPGFEDWYKGGSKHYSAAADPLKISNLDEQLLAELRDVQLSEISIRHVMIVKLESTRKDIFPIKKDGMAWDKLSSTYKRNVLPEEAQAFIASLTPTAKYITGDYDDGFSGKRPEDGSWKRRGGINFNNAFTTSTYTLKSLTGTICGLSPLAADFNVEESHHIYQPCLPHIFNAFNSLDHTHDRPSTGKEFAAFPWKSSFMQSVTMRYDKQDKLMPRLGFTQENLVDWWSLTENPKFGPLNISDVNYYGMPEVAVEDYIRDAFVKAKQNNERVFLSHLTSTTHHDFGIPEHEKYVSLADDEEWTDLSRYLNAAGYVDRWLKKVLDILESEGVADETLVIFVGDHGLSIAERGTITPYSNPHVANYHVPLVISHPRLPPINIDGAANSIQILPTILDLLLETGSLSNSESRAATDLVQNYEGQSLLRPMRNFSEETGQGAWQITVMNPGGSTLAVRDARQPDWRLIVPVYGNYEWRFTNLSTDPHEKNPIMTFDLKGLVRMLGGDNGTDTARWVEEAAVVTQWWAEENYKRWRYKP